MTEKNLKNLNRAELIDIVLKLSEANAKLKLDNASLRNELEQIQINIESSGSIAEASLNLTNVFAEAQRAADLYLENIKRQEEASQAHVLKLITETTHRCMLREQDTEDNCEAMEEEARARALKLENETREACSLLMQKTQAACRRMLHETEERCAEMQSDPSRLTDEYETEPPIARRRFFSRREAV